MAASFNAFRFSAKEHIYIARKIKIVGKNYESPVRSRTVAQYCCFYSVRVSRGNIFHYAKEQTIIFYIYFFEFFFVFWFTFLDVLY